MSNLRERAAELAQTWPGYAAILDFYVGVKEAQDASRPAVRVSRAQAQEHGTGATAAPGRPLIDRDDFPIDVKASVELFGALCKLAKRANPHLGAQVDRIEDALAAGALDLTGLLAGGGRDSTIGQAAADQGLDVHALAFLVRGSTQPSVDAVRYQLCDENLDGQLAQEQLPDLRFRAHPQPVEGSAWTASSAVLALRLRLEGRSRLLLRVRKPGCRIAPVLPERGRRGAPHRFVRQVPPLHQDDRLQNPRSARSFARGSRHPASGYRGESKRIYSRCPQLLE